MVLKATLGELVAAENVLKRLNAVRLPPGHAKAVYRLGKLARTLAAETKHFSDEHAAAVREFGEEREATPAELTNGLGPRVCTVTTEHWPAFCARIDDLTKVEVDLDVALLAPEVLDLFELSAADLAALSPLVGEWKDDA